MSEKHIVILARGDNLEQSGTLALNDTFARSDILERGDTLARRHFSRE